MWGVVGKVLALGWSPDVQIMDWTPLGAGEGFEALLLNFPTHPQVEM
jgi:hypothetical protein